MSKSSTNGLALDRRLTIVGKNIKGSKGLAIKRLLEVTPPETSLILIRDISIGRRTRFLSYRRVNQDTWKSCTPLMAQALRLLFFLTRRTSVGT